MRKKFSVIVTCLSVVLLLAGCAQSETESRSSISVPINILERLNFEGTFNWLEDRFASAIDSNVENIYTSNGCSVWVFSNEADARRANNEGVFDFYEGEAWYGQDGYSSKGVTLLTQSKNSPCAKVVFQELNWTTDNQTDESSISGENMAGKWGSYGWMDDQVGMFLKIQSIGGTKYVGTFYSQGQSGGVFKDISVSIQDSGDGTAEVTWPSGNTTVATWGKRDANTPKDMDPKWKGDIWFDCLGEVDFAQSRADCNFYFASN